MAILNEKQLALFGGKNWGTVVTLRADGSPHSTPVWIDTDGENVLFNTSMSRAKARHIERDPRVAITVLPSDDLQAGYVTVYGRATMSEEGGKEHIDKLANKYLGVDEYPWLQPGERRVIVTIHPEKVDAQGF
jgi:PPOX class probable F420-dependent enzyme